MHAKSKQDHMDLNTEGMGCLSFQMQWDEGSSSSQDSRALKTPQTWTLSLLRVEGSFESKPLQSWNLAKVETSPKLKDLWAGPQLMGEVEDETLV